MTLSLCCECLERIGMIECVNCKKRRLQTKKGGRRVARKKYCSKCLFRHDGKFYCKTCYYEKFKGKINEI